MLFYNVFSAKVYNRTFYASSELQICPRVNYNSTSDVQVHSLNTGKYVKHQINPIIPENFSQNFWIISYFLGKGIYFVSIFISIFPEIKMP